MCCLFIFKASRGIEPLKKVLTVPRINHSAMTPNIFNLNIIYGMRDSNTLYVSYPKGATNQFVIYHFNCFKVQFFYRHKTEGT